MTEIKHGTHHAYNKRKCRCGVCTTFHNAYVYAQRAPKNSKVEWFPAAPLDAGREEPPPSFRPATYLCDHCGSEHLSRQARGRHVADAHPFTRIRPASLPDPAVWVELPGDQWSAA